MMVQQRKLVIAAVKAQGTNPFMRLLGGIPNGASSGAPGTGGGGVVGGELSITKKSKEAVEYAVERLLVPNDTLVLLLVHPGPANAGPAQIQQCEEMLQQGLRRQLHTTIEVAGARNVQVHIVVRLGFGLRETVIECVRRLGAAILVMGKPGGKLPGFLGVGFSPNGAAGAGPESGKREVVNPELMAKELPSTCKVMVVHQGKVVTSLTGELASNSVEMSDHNGVPATPPSNPQGASQLPPGYPQAQGVPCFPTEVMREVYGEQEFSADQIRAATENFSDRHRIGEGGSGSVFFGRIGQRMIAVKRIRWWADGAAGAPQLSHDSSFRLFLTELRVMKRIQHPNLLELLGVCASDGELLLVSDFLAEGSLDHRMRDQRKPLLTWDQRLNIAVGAAKGLKYLHRNCQPPIIHRDVKTANILLDQNLEAKVADFGLAKITPESIHSQPFAVTAIMGTQGYLAPEYGMTSKITKAIDVFAFGVVLFELISGHIPYHPDRKPPYLSIYAMDVACKQEYLRLLDPRLKEHGYDPKQLEGVIMLASLCLNSDPAERPNMEEVVSWLSQLVDGTMGA